MVQSCDIRNSESSGPVVFSANDPTRLLADTERVDEIDQPNWYLQEWFAHFEKRQAALVNELGWDKSRANHIWHGRQPYRRETVNEVAMFLGIKPYELLMPPDEAIALRSLRDAARAIAANQPAGRMTDHPSKQDPTRTLGRGSRAA